MPWFRLFYRDLLDNEGLPRNPSGGEGVGVVSSEWEAPMTWIALASLALAAAVGFAVLATTLQYSE